MSPSAFIPFCEFGGNMSDTGFKYEQFNLHVCSCFETKMLNDLNDLKLGTIQQLRHPVVAPTGVGKNDGSIMHRGGW